MSELTKQQRIDRLAEWAKLDEEGWNRYETGIWWEWITVGFTDEGRAVQIFDPFNDLNHAYLLLLECERRGVLPAYLKVKHMIVVAGLPHNSQHMSPAPRTESLAQLSEMATAKQQTEAVWAVAFPEEK